jgi:hypothetical protein
MLSVPPGTVCAYYSRRGLFIQYSITLLIAGIGLGLAVLLALYLPLILSILGCVAVLAGFGVFIYLNTRNDYGFIELQDITLRAKHMYTGRIMVRHIDEIESLTTLLYQGRYMEAVIAEKMLGRVRGIDIHFQGEEYPLRIMRNDPTMTNAKELIEAIVYRMQQMGELDYEIINHAGKPLLRRIFWMGKPVASRPKSMATIYSKSLLFIALIFGPIVSFLWKEQKEFFDLSSVPPQEISITDLIGKGPGANRHLTIVDYQPGGYVCQSQYGTWCDVWVALFPADPQLVKPKEIAVVLHSKQIRDEASLNRLLQSGRIAGICSTDHRSSWGSSLGPKLTEANFGCSLTSAWSIEEMSKPPDEKQLLLYLTGAIACFAIVIVTSAFILWRNVRI